MSTHDEMRKECAFYADEVTMDVLLGDVVETAVLLILDAVSHQTGGLTKEKLRQLHARLADSFQDNGWDYEEAFSRIEDVIKANKVEAEDGLICFGGYCREI